MKRRNARALIGMVGVQSNQFHHTLDLAREFRAAGLPVVIGGFHVSGCLSMLKEIPPEIQEALDMGCSLFAGEAEGRLDMLLQAAAALVELELHFLEVNAEAPQQHPGAHRPRRVVLVRDDERRAAHTSRAFLPA